MDNMKVSIITVCYNSAKTIEQTIQSVINQFYINIEYIIIDGGSTDGTLNIIKKYEDKISYWVSEPDDGLYDAMNKGISVATGDIVGIINSDDWYNEKAIAKVVDCFNKGKADVVYGDIINISANGKELYKSNKSVVQDELFLRIIYDHPSFFVKKSAYEKYGGFQCKYRISADYHLMLKLYSNGAIFKYVEFPIAYFRLSGGIGHSKVRCAYMDDRNIALEFYHKAARKEIYYKKIIERYNLKRKLALNNFYYQRLKKSLTLEERKNLFNRVLDLKEYIIFGAGEDGIECYHWLNDHAIKVVCFFDNSLIRQSETIENLRIYSPEKINANKKIKILIANTNYIQEIKRQLEQLGLKYKKDYFDFKEIQDEIIREYIKVKMPWVMKVPKHAWS